MKLHNIIIIYLLVISTFGLNAQLKVINNGYVGIGENITPNSLLELNDNGWLRLNAPSGTSGILFYKSGTSTPTDVQNGGKIYFDGNNNRLRIGTMNNNSFRHGITIDGPNGNVGIGTNPSSTYKLRIQGNSLLNGNLRLENTAYPGQRFHLDISGLNFMSSLIELPGIPAGQIGSSSQQWNTIYSSAIYGNGVYLGSDKRNKENIREIDKSLTKIMNINPVIFDFIPIQIPQDENWRENVTQLNNRGKNRFGFFAQDLLEVIPEIVEYIEEDDNYYVDYIALIPILVKAIQEQQVDIEKMKLQASLKKFETTSAYPDNNNMFKSGNMDEINLQNSLLYQNNPNPFNEITTIRFVIPESVDQAMLYIYNMQGMQIQSHQINDRGHSALEIRGAILKPGMYLYTLIVDGRAIDTKRMILTD